MRRPGAIDPATIQHNVGRFRDRKALAVCPVCDTANTIWARERGTWPVTECRNCGTLWRPKEVEAS